jgi:DNA-binding transcriptional regulator of glucitol operon
VVQALLMVLIWAAIACAVLSWWGPRHQRRRQMQQGQRLALQFRAELQRRAMGSGRRHQSSNP